MAVSVKPSARHGYHITRKAEFADFLNQQKQSPKRRPSSSNDSETATTTTTKTMIKATLQYLHPSSSDPAQYNASQAGDSEAATHEGGYESRTVSIHNGRTRNDFSLDIHGFRLAPYSPAKPLDYYDDQQLETIYNPQVEEWLLSQIPGAKEVHVFDHTRRSSSADERTSKRMREPSAVIHNDYTAWSAEKRVQEILGSKSSTSDSRFAIVNVWRPLVAMVENWPMTVCDSTTVQVDRDLVSVPRVSKDGRKGEIQMATYHPDHQWYYFPHMTPNEVLLLKTYDSLSNGDVNQYTIHTAFDVGKGKEEGPPRESLETRTFVLFD